MPVLIPFHTELTEFDLDKVYAINRYDLMMAMDKTWVAYDTLGDWDTDIKKIRLAGLG